MTNALSPAAERTEVRIAGALTIAEAAATHERLAHALGENAGPLTVDLSAINEIDSAGLQLLLALAREADRVTLARPSACVAALSGRLGLHDALCPQEDRHGA